MMGMTGAFAVAGIAQVYMERKIGMDFLAVQEAVEVHFAGLVLAAFLAQHRPGHVYLELRPVRAAQRRGGDGGLTRWPSRA